MNIYKLSFVALIFLFSPISNLYAKQVTINNNGDWVSEVKKLRPGDTAVFTKGRFGTGSYSTKNKTISINGTNNQPITLIGSGSHDTIFDGQSSGVVLVFENCSNLIIENLTITNPSQSTDGRRNRIPVKSDSLSEGLVIRGGNDITIRKSLFNNIGTRGIFTAYSNGHLKRFKLENSLFFNIGTDTASGDINMNSGEDWTIRHNLFAGNVDGIVNDGYTLGGGLIEENIFINHWQEDNIDIKGHLGPKKTTIQKNIIYTNRAKTGVTVQNSSRDITIHNNMFYHGAKPGQIWIHGRNTHNGTTNEPVKNINITNNVLAGDINTQDNRGIMVLLAKDRGISHRPVPVLNVNISDNFILNQQDPIVNLVGNNVRLSNNKFNSLPEIRNQEFKNLELSILDRIVNTFSPSIIQEAFNEAQVPLKSGAVTTKKPNPPNNLRIL